MNKQSVFYGLQLLSANGNVRHYIPGFTPVAITPKVISSGNAEEHYLPNTATFRFSSYENIDKAMNGAAEESLTLRWESPVAIPFAREEFRKLCMAQADHFNAQLLNRLPGNGQRQIEGRVGSFDISWRMKPDTIETQRHCVPLSFFETFALGGTPSPYGVVLDP